MATRSWPMVGMEPRRIADERSTEAIQRRAQNEGRLGGNQGYYTVSEIASQYGVHPNQVTQWKKQVVEALPDVLEDKRRKKKRIMRTSSVSSISRSGS